MTLVLGIEVVWCACVHLLFICVKGLYCTCVFWCCVW